jgi:hypothetical protein
MKIPLTRLYKFFGPENSTHLTAIWQGVVHVATIYLIARLCIPWLADVSYGKVLPFLSGHRLGGNPFQFLFSHLLALSLLPGFVAGCVTARLLHNRVVRFSWAVPVAVLLLSFVFAGPGMYPTMLWQSDLRTAIHYFFGGGFNIVGEYQNPRDLPRLMTMQNMGDFIRGYSQLRATVPVYVGVAYSSGAWLSLRMKRTSTHAHQLQGGGAETISAS